RSYEIRIGERHGTVADLVDSEKLACRAGLAQPDAVIGLAFYVEPGDTWTNDLGDSWSVQRLLQAELDRKPEAGSVDTINRLMAISFALARIEDADKTDGELLRRAREHVEELQDHALQLQNGDGSWHPGFLAYRGTGTDADGVLLATGSILGWLVYSLPADRLEDPKVVLGLNYLEKQLASGAGRRSALPSSSREIIAQMKAARALSLYDARYFAPRTPPKPAQPAGPDDNRQTNRVSAYPGSPRG
ncbi:MAG: hypothetical protein ACYC6Y_08360, partial [Thermoguttaceae bacterium]